MARLIMKPILACLLLIIANSVIAQSTIGQQIYIPANSNGYWGFINTTGEWVIEPQYEDAQSFSEGLAAVKYYGKWGYIDAQGKWHIQPKFADAKKFHEGIACVLQFDHWGYIDMSGQWIIEPKFKKASAFGEKKALVGSEGNLRIIDRSGSSAISFPVRDGITFSEGLAYVEYDGYKGYINPKGQWQIRHPYEKSFSFSEGLAIFKLNSQYGFLDVLGKKAVEPVFGDATRFSGGLAAVRQYQSWGYINAYGEVVINYKYEDATPFQYGYAAVKKDGKYGLINSDGGWVLEPRFDQLKKPNLAVPLKTISEAITRQKYQSWAERGEFETSEDYQRRLESMQSGAFTDGGYTELASLLIPRQRIRLGRYLADYEAFMVHVPYALPFLLPVDIEEARYIADLPGSAINWDSLQYSAINDRFVVSAAVAIINGKAYRYQAPNRTDLKSQMTFTKPVATIPDLDRQAFKKDIPLSNGSDVDQNIPVYKWQQDQIFALVVGNEDYSSYQNGLEHESNVPYAENDARIFAEYLKKTFGVPESNIQLLINGTTGQIRQGLSKLKAISKAWEGKATLIFYYAGHGAPHQVSEKPYLLPVDVNANNLEYGIALEEVYDYLSRYETRRSLVFMDACFTGAGREKALLASRGVRIQPKTPFVLGNLVVFSATSGRQTALPYHAKSHGMFTYFLLKAWQESDGKMKYGPLAEYLQEMVNKTSVLLNSKEQVPTVKVSPIFEYTWKDFDMYLESTSSSTKHPFD